jgi:CRISPR system Cascade subunit CasB
MSKDQTNFQKAISAILEWWTTLHHEPHHKADRSKLKRASSELEVACIPAFHQLRIKLKELNFSSDKSIVYLAILLALVKDNETEARLGAQLANASQEGRSPKMSELRFRKMLECQELADLLPHMRRAIQMLKGKVNIPDLWNVIYFWHKPETKKRLAYAYYEHM